MDITWVLLVLVFGGMMLWVIREHQERLIAKRGYKWYIAYSGRWKKKRRECYKRFGYRCAVCNSPHNLEAHHRTYRNLYNEKPGDLTALCGPCHRIAPKSDGLYKG